MKTKRTLALCLMIMLTLSFPSLAAPAFAAGYGDTEGHWGAAAIEKWSDYGVLRGNGDGTFAPDRAMTQDELATVLTRTFGYTARNGGALPGYAESWRGAEDAVRGAIAAGAMTPEEAALPLTRELAVKIIAAAYHIAPEEGASGFADDADIGEAYRGYVAAFQKNGYVIGTGAAGFSPKKAYTRAEAMQVIDNMVGDIYGEPGERTGDVKGDLIVNASGVTVKDAVVSGDLIIADGVGEGDATLDDTEVKGRLIIRGGGDHSIRLLGAKTVIPNVLIYKSASGTPVRVVFEAGANVQNVAVENPAIIEVKEGAKIASLTINNAAVSVSAVRGSVGAVEIAEDVATEMPEGAVNTNVAPSAAGTTGGSGGSSGGSPSSPTNPTNPTDPTDPATPSDPPVDLSEYTEVTTFGALRFALESNTEKIVLSESVTATENVLIPQGSELLITDEGYLDIPQGYTLTVEGAITLGLDHNSYGNAGRGSMRYGNTGTILDCTNITKVNGGLMVDITGLTSEAAAAYFAASAVSSLYLTQSGTLTEDFTIPADKEVRFYDTSPIITIGDGKTLTVAGRLTARAAQFSDLDAIVQATGGYVEFQAETPTEVADALAGGFSVEILSDMTITGDLRVPQGSLLILPKGLTVDGNLEVYGHVHVMNPLIVAGELTVGPHTEVGYKRDGNIFVWATPNTSMSVGGNEIFGENSVHVGSGGQTPAAIFVYNDGDVRTYSLHEGTTTVTEDVSVDARFFVDEIAHLVIAEGKTLTLAGSGGIADRLYGEEGALLTLQSGAHIRIGDDDAGLEENTVYEWQSGTWKKLLVTQ
jgi:hypothetical protein